MSEKIKVLNPQKFDVGVVTPDNKLGINIKAGTFAYMTEDDIGYINSTSRIFQRGLLRVENPVKEAEVMENIGIDVENEPNFVTDDDIRKAFGLSAKKLEEWLAGITEEYLLDRVFEIARAENLPSNKLKVLQAVSPERDILGE